MWTRPRLWEVLWSSPAPWLVPGWLSRRLPGMLSLRLAHLRPGLPTAHQSCSHILQLRHWVDVSQVGCVFLIDFTLICSSVSLVVLFALKSLILWLWSLQLFKIFAWYVFFYLFTFSLPVSLYLKSASIREHIVGSYPLICYASSVFYLVYLGPFHIFNYWCVRSLVYYIIFCFYLIYFFFFLPYCGLLGTYFRTPFYRFLSLALSIALYIIKLTQYTGVILPVQVKYRNTMVHCPPPFMIILNIFKYKNTFIIYLS